MTEAAMEVLFALLLPDGTLAEETALAGMPGPVAEALGGADAPYGRLVVRGGAQPDLRLPDDLLPLADALVVALPSLRAGKQAMVAAYSQPFTWSLTPVDGRITTVWMDDEDEQGRRTDEAAALVPALAAATRRLVALLSRGKAGGPAKERLIKTLADRLEQLETLPA